MGSGQEGSLECLDLLAKALFDDEEDEELIMGWRMRRRALMNQLLIWDMVRLACCDISCFSSSDG